MQCPFTKDFNPFNLASKLTVCEYRWKFFLIIMKLPLCQDILATGPSITFVLHMLDPHLGVVHKLRLQEEVGR